MEGKKGKSRRPNVEVPLMRPSRFFERNAVFQCGLERLGNNLGCAGIGARASEFS